MLFTTNGRGSWAKKVLELDQKTSITHCCIINGYTISLLTFWRLKLHSNWTSYDNIQIHVNKKNSRFTAKVVTKKISLCGWYRICNNKLINSIRKIVAPNLGIFSSSSFTQDRRVASWINLIDYCTFPLFVNKAPCCAKEERSLPFFFKESIWKASCSDCSWQQ